MSTIAELSTALSSFASVARFCAKPSSCWTDSKSLAPGLNCEFKATDADNLFVANAGMCASVSEAIRTAEPDIISALKTRFSSDAVAASETVARVQVELSLLKTAIAHNVICDASPLERLRQARLLNNTEARRRLAITLRAYVSAINALVYPIGAKIVCHVSETTDKDKDSALFDELLKSAEREQAAQAAAAEAKASAKPSAPVSAQASPITALATTVEHTGPPPEWTLADVVEADRFVMPRALAGHPSLDRVYFAAADQLHWISAGEVSDLDFSFDCPQAMCFDNNGSNLYVADSEASLIRRIDLSSGAISTFAGGGSLTTGALLSVSLKGASGVVFDSKRNCLYASATDCNRVVRIPGSGKGEVQVLVAGLSAPRGLCIDARSDTLFIADTANNRVLRVALSSGAQSPVVTRNHTLKQPSCVAVDFAGYLYVGEKEGGVQCIAPSGQCWTVSSELQSVDGLTVNNKGDVFVCDALANRVVCFTNKYPFSVPAQQQSEAKADTQQQQQQLRKFLSDNDLSVCADAFVSAGLILADLALLDDAGLRKFVADDNVRSKLRIALGRERPHIPVSTPATTTPTPATVPLSRGGHEQETKRPSPAVVPDPRSMPLPSLGEHREVDLSSLNLDRLPVVRSSSTGQVYRTTFRATDVAVKTLIAGESKEEREAFVREIAFVMSLVHPRLVIPLAACTKGPRLALITEWMSGGTLAERLYGEKSDLVATSPAPSASAPLSVKDKFTTALDIALALSYLHSFTPAFLHNDVRPETVVFEGSGRAKLTLIEAGIGKSGTPAYMAPERFVPGHTIDDKSDVYSFGAVLTELFAPSGSPRPFDPNTRFQVPASDRDKTQTQTRTHAHPPVPAQLPRGLTQLLNDCMSADPKERPSAAQLTIRLQELADTCVPVQPEPTPAPKPAQTPEPAVSVPVSVSVPQQQQATATETKAAEAKTPTQTQPAAAPTQAEPEAPRAAWSIPADLLREPLHWDVKDAGLRFAELNPEASPVQRKHFEYIRQLCGKHVKVSRVVLVDNKSLEHRFAAQHDLLRRLIQQPGFQPTPATTPSKQQMEKQLSRRLCDLDGVRGIGLMFNGTHEEMAIKMCTSGLINFHAKDAGYFGSGVYVTPQAEYAALYPCELYNNPKNARGEWALVVAWALLANVYPITRDADYKDIVGKDGKTTKAENSNFFGKPMDKAYDSHFVQVDPDLDFQAFDPSPTAKPPRNVFEELVVKNEGQLLPRFIVYFTACDVDW